MDIEGVFDGVAPVDNEAVGVGVSVAVWVI